MAKVIYAANDGSHHETRAAADFHDMKPVVTDILAEIPEFTPEAVAFVLNNKDVILDAFNFNVTRAELDTLAAELKALVAAHTTTGTTATPFLVQRAEDIKRAFKSLRPRLNEEEKVLASVGKLITGGADATLARIIVQFQEQIVNAYKAASPRAQSNPKGSEMLAAQQEIQREQRAEDERQANARGMTYKAYKANLFMTASETAVTVAELRALRKEELGEPEEPVDSRDAMDSNDQ